jgi:hypothetical protein
VPGSCTILDCSREKRHCSDPEISGFLRTPSKTIHLPMTTNTEVLTDEYDRGYEGSANRAAVEIE